MLRILEPEVMDTKSDAEEYDAMDFTEANTRFAEDALALISHVRSPRVLDLGTGTARIPIAMLERRADLEVLAVDLAEEMLTVATRNLVKAGVEARCQLARMDVKALELGDQRYDLVMSNSTVHHIPEPLMLFRQIARLATPSCAILVRDLFRPASVEEAWATVMRSLAGEGERQRQLFFDSLSAALTVDEVDALVREAGLVRMHVAEVSERHWTAERPALG